MTIALFLFYFFMVWFVPWEGFKLFPSISSVYLFDVTFVLILSLLFKISVNFRAIYKKKFVIKLIGTVILGLISLIILKIFNVKTPFKYLDNLVLQLVIFAPIIEELVYRHVLYYFIDRDGVDHKKKILINAGVFSLSHAAAFFTLPSDFFVFLGFQLVYTFILGIICAQSRSDEGSVIYPIGLHFVFNLIFLVGLPLI